jgi:hypothetical protein
MASYLIWNGTELVASLNSVHRCIVNMKMVNILTLLRLALRRITAGIS